MDDALAFEDYHSMVDGQDCRNMAAWIQDILDCCHAGMAELLHKDPLLPMV